MSDKHINDVLNRFFSLSEAHKKITDDMAAALKEYEDFCITSDADLNKKTSEILKKVSELEYLMQYAREHTTELEEAQMPFETSESTLESLRQKIQLDSHNDPNAESLYTKATGQKMFLQREVERVRKLISSSKVQAKRLYDSTMSDLTEKKAKQEVEYKAFIMSNDVKEYLKLLSADAAAFNSASTTSISDNTSISLGQRRVRLPVPAELEQELTVTTAGVFNSAAKTIGAPFSFPMDRGSVLYIDFDEKNEMYMLGGIQRFLLNTVKYFGQRLQGIWFCDPKHNGSEGLGHIVALSKGNYPFITVLGEAREAAGLLSSISELPGVVKRVFVFRDFPEGYDSESAEIIVKFCENAERYGAAVVLTHLQNSAPENSNKQAMRKIAAVIRSRNGGFYLDSSREGLFWYSAPSDIPDDIRRTFVEQRRRAAEAGNMAAINTSAYYAQNKTTGVPMPTYRVPEPITLAPTYNEPESAAPAPIYSDLEPAAPASTYNEPEPTASVPIDNELEPTASVPTYDEPESTAPAPAYNEPEPVAPTPVNNATEADVSVLDSVDAVSDMANNTTETDTSNEIEAAKTAGYTEKGRRTLEGIGYGTDETGKILYADFEENGVVTYICGLSGAGRTDFVCNIIDGAAESCHPDDLEIWLIDFTEGELKRYVTNTLPHIRYLIIGGGDELAYSVVDRLGEVVNRRTAYLKDKGFTFAEVPKDICLPEVLVILNGFENIRKALGNSDKKIGADYGAALHDTLLKCAECGVRVVMAGSDFTDKGSVPDYFSGIKLQCAALTNHDVNISRLFEGAPLSVDDRNFITHIPTQSAFVRTSYGENGFTLAHIALLHSDEELSKLCEKFDSEITVSYIFAAEDAGSRIDKKPIIADRSKFVPFENRRICFERRVGKLGEVHIFAGEPCGLKSTASITVTEMFAENLLVAVPPYYKEDIALVVLSIISSLTLQDIPTEIISSEQNPVYSYLRSHTPVDAAAESEGTASVCRRIRKLKEELDLGSKSGRFFVIFGLNKLAAEMRTLPENSDGAYNALGDLRYLMERGSKVGYHFVVIQDNPVDIEKEGLSADLFTHIITYTGKEHTFRYYDKLGEVLCFTPFMHNGIELDGFRIDENGTTAAFIPDDYLM